MTLTPYPARKWIRVSRPRQVHLDLFPGDTVDGVAGAHGHPRNAVRNLHATQAAGEGLFVDVGMMQDAGGKHFPAGRHDLPSVGVVVPALIGVTDGHIEPERPLSVRADPDVDHVRLA